MNSVTSPSVWSQIHILRWKVPWVNLKVHEQTWWDRLRIWKKFISMLEYGYLKMGNSGKVIAQIILIQVPTWEWENHTREIYNTIWSYKHNINHLLCQPRTRLYRNRQYRVLNSASRRALQDHPASHHLSSNTLSRYRKIQTMYRMNLMENKPNLINKDIKSDKANTHLVNIKEELPYKNKFRLLIYQIALTVI